MASLGVAIKNGSDACAARKPEDFAGDQLIAYARLCSLGIVWPMVDQAATRYIESKDEPKPQLPLAYGMKLEAELQAKDLKAVMATATTMLQTLPYDLVVDTAVNEAFDYTQLAYPQSSLKLHAVRQPVLLSLLAQAKPPLPRQALYADALAYAAEQQYMGLAADDTVAALDAALGSSEVTKDESLLIGALRAQYAMLGQPLPKLKLTASLDTLKLNPAIDSEQGAAMALMVFPPWCAQCVRIAAMDLVKASATLQRGAVQVFALLAAPATDLPLEHPKPTAIGMPVPPPTPAEQLRHTPTFLVPPDTLDLLHATDYPWVVVTDHAGIVRFLGVAPETALKTGMYIDRATDHVAEQWPSKFVPTVPVVAPR